MSDREPWAGQPVDENRPDESKLPAPPRRRRLRKLVLGLIVVALPVLIWLAPQIVGRFASQPSVLRTIAPNLPRNLRIGKASLRWESPVLLRDVTLEAADGSDMVTVEAVTSRESLWQLVSNIKLPLTLDLEGIHTTYAVPRPTYAGRLNLDKALDDFAHSLQRLSAIGFPASPRKTTVRLTGGSITLVDEAGTVLTRFAPVSGNCVLLPNTGRIQGDERSQLTLTLPVEQPGQRGTCELKADWSNLRLPAATEQDWGVASLKLQHVPVDALQPLVNEAFDGGKLAGEVDGELQARLSRDSDGRVRLGSDLQLGPSSGPGPALWVVREREPPHPFYIQSVSSASSLAYDATIDQFEIRPFTVHSEPFEVSLAGTVDELSRQSLCDVSGTVRCDAQEVLSLVPPALREQIQVDGLRLSGFNLKGPLRLMPPRRSSASRPRASLNAADARTLRLLSDQNLSVTARLAWDRMGAFGVESRQGLMQVSLDAGIVQLQPVGVVVNRGRLRSLPDVDLRQTPAVLEVRQGPLLEEVELSEELCRSWLKYISPVTANATSVSGRVSLATDEGRIPIDSFNDARVQGRLTIRDAAVGPGPLVQPIIEIVEKVQKIIGRAGKGPRGENVREQLKLKLLDQEVPFQLVEGRVHHRDLGFQAGDVLLSTSGSVGMDEGLDLTMRIDLPDAWFADRGPVLASLRDEPIELRVAGTLEHPQIDSRPLAELGKRAGVKAAEGLIFDLINKGMERRRERGP